ncbi:hypothetical protein [Streptomyces sp. NPDC059092]|uniref:hypothetical protein n=1 Tax=Streptomyces sp. NPDC059092 TaxID=3346725 RepID=UPI003694A373
MSRAALGEFLDAMVRTGQSSEKAGPDLPPAFDARVRAEQHDVADGEASGAEVLRRA